MAPQRYVAKFDPFLSLDWAIVEEGIKFCHLATLLQVCYLILCIMGLFMHPFFFSVLLFDVVVREETLWNVMMSVTRNSRSILLTALFAVILVYLFSIVGFIFFKDDFILDADQLDPLVAGSGEGGAEYCTASSEGCSAGDMSAAARYGECCNL